MKHVKFVLSKDLESIRKNIENYNGRMGVLKDDLDRMLRIVEKLLKEEIEVVKALSLLEGLIK